MTDPKPAPQTSFARAYADYDPAASRMTWRFSSAFRSRSTRSESMVLTCCIVLSLT